VTKLQETCSGGGPVIAIPAELAATWRGTLPPKDADVPEGWVWGDGGVTCDYDRACEHVNDKIATEYGAVGWLPVGEGRALVLDLELITAVMPITDGLLIIRNYEGEPTLESAGKLLEAVLEDAWKEFPQTITLPSGRLFLFDSAFEGAENPAHIIADEGVAIAETGAGEYRVEVAVREGLDFIRLRRI